MRCFVRQSSMVCFLGLCKAFSDGIKCMECLLGLLLKTLSLAS